MSLLLLPTASPLSSKTMTRFDSDEVELGWMDQGNCQQIDGDLFFNDDSTVSMTREAKQACSTCPVMDQCLEWIMSMPSTDGVFAGTTEGERKLVLEQREKGLLLTATEYRDAGGVRRVQKSA